MVGRLVNMNKNFFLTRGIMRFIAGTWSPQENFSLFFKVCSCFFAVIVTLVLVPIIPIMFLLDLIMLPFTSRF
jgi:hypothetical protein